jgi:hypothetical protein
LTKLKPNNRKVTAYWLPDIEGNTQTIYLYQDGEYIGNAAPRQTYNDCKIEWTDQDEAAYLSQAKRVSQFDKLIKDRRASIPKVELINAEISKNIENITFETLPELPVGNQQNDLDLILQEFKNKNYSEQARISI